MSTFRALYQVLYQSLHFVTLALIFTDEEKCFTGA